MSTLRALLIEDNPADVYLIRQALKEERVQFELEVLDNGEAACAWIDRFVIESAVRPDVILLDLNLPRCDGKEVLQKLMESSRFQRAPVIVITSSNSPNDQEDCLRMGASYYFRKHSDLGEFMKIARVIKDLFAGHLDSCAGSPY